MNNYKLVVEYDGTKYHGFQIQADGIVTIQGVLEKAISQLANEEVRIVGAGRTDAGVHGLNQVINFHSNLTVPVTRLPLALNCLLPKDIRIKTATLVTNDFHARYLAKSKTYLYRIEFGLIESAFSYKYCWWVKQPLVWDKVLEAGKKLEGRFDFAGFAASGSNVKSTVRTLNSFTLKVTYNFAELRFTADGFLYHMVRNIVGTLMEVGLGRRNVGSIDEIMESRDRRLAGVTAPATGLFLEKVDY